MQASSKSRLNKSNMSKRFEEDEVEDTESDCNNGGEVSSNDDQNEVRGQIS